MNAPSLFHRRRTETTPENPARDFPSTIFAPASDEAKARLALFTGRSVGEIPPTLTENDIGFALEHGNRDDAARLVRDAAEQWTRQGGELAPWDGHVRLALALQAVYTELQPLDGDGRLLARINERFAPRLDPEEQTGQPTISSSTGATLLIGLGINEWSTEARAVSGPRLDAAADQLSRAQLALGGRELNHFLGEVVGLRDPARRTETCHTLGSAAGSQLDALLTGSGVPTPEQFKLGCVLADALFVEQREQLWGGYSGTKDGSRPTAAEAARLVTRFTAQDFDGLSAVGAFANPDANWRMITAHAGLPEVAPGFELSDLQQPADAADIRPVSPDFEHRPNF